MSYLNSLAAVPPPIDASELQGQGVSLGEVAMGVKSEF